MKTLSNHTILYDGECPMCNLYTKAFIDTTMLDKNGRKKYQQMPESFKGLVNHKRAMDEIALVNSHTGEVSYGLQSLFKILSNAFPVLNPLFRFKPFAWTMNRFYKFISFNRRVIMPSKSADPALEPSFNERYRLAYIIFSLFVSAFILNNYSSNLSFLPSTTIARELAICGGQIVWQLSLIHILNRSKAWDYIGNLMTISLAGAIALSLIQLLPSWSQSTNNIVFGVFFMVVVGLMFLEHIRRTRILGLTWILTASWTIYRIIILLIIINL